VIHKPCQYPKRSNEPNHRKGFGYLVRTVSLKKLLILITSFAFVISCSSLLGPEEDDSGSSWVPTVMFNGNNGTDTLSFNAVGEDSYPTYELSKEWNSPEIVDT